MQAPGPTVAAGPPTMIGAFPGYRTAVLSMTTTPSRSSMTIPAYFGALLEYPVAGR